ncbi:MAG: DUF3029 family protein [Clostridia bacterium]|nr:DUF3029 family protein [Clostridia bacterium]
METKLLLEHAVRIADADTSGDVTAADARIIAFLLENCEFSFPQSAVFFGDCSCETVTRQITWRRQRRFCTDIFTEENRKAVSAGAYSGDPDFGHTAPLWDDILKLGLPGLRARVLELAPENDSVFVQSELLVLDAASAFLKRIAPIAADAGKTELAAGLLHLADHAPETLFQAMQLMFVYYTLQHHFEGTNLRTLGRLDRLFAPFAEKEDPQTVRNLVRDFLREIDTLRAPANIPFMLCGSDASGRDLTNDMSRLILETYTELKPSNTKFHILCTPDTPKDFLRSAFESVKNGANSMVFMNDRMVIESLRKLGETPEAAVNYSVVGCYECGGAEETACTCNARLNLPKALELALHGGCDALTGEKIGADTDGDYPTFEALYDAFCVQVRYLARQAMDITDRYEEKYALLHASPFFTATYPTCLKKGADVYCGYSAAYNNSSLNAIGLATAVDSLAAIRKLVYEDKRMTLDEFIAVLDSNWKDQAVLQGIIRKKYPRYGNGDPAVDALAGSVVKVLSDAVNNVPNAKGGVYRLGLFSIDWCIDYGAQTAASADGRSSGETLSQNTGASFGANRDGTTAHLHSVTAIDASDTANGAIVDLDLHSSAVRGENGTTVLAATLQTYLEKGGFAIHYNVLDTETLEDARVHPENYPNLQVRLCGWNVKFTELSASAQEAFIRRSRYQFR